MAKIGRSYPRPDYLADTNSSAALRRFERSPTEGEDRALRREIAAAVIALLFIVAFIGWALVF
jgi:hypothetical protein